MNEDITDEEIAGLVMEREVHPNLSYAQQAEKILEECAPQVALSMVRMATSSPNDRVRLQAAQYVLDRTVFKVEGGGAHDPLQTIFEGLEYNTEEMRSAEK